MNITENIYPLENLELFANQVVEGFITGMHKSPYHGFSVEFAEHRLYNTGESTRHIDWKLFARTDKLFIKRYEEETNLRCQIIIDSSSSMYYPEFKYATSKNPNKMLFSIMAAASLMNLLRRQRDAVGLSSYSNKINIHTPSKTTMRHHRLLYHELEELLKIDGLKERRESNFSSSIHHIAERVQKRSLVMIFSDMIADDNLETVFSALKHLKYNQHEIILFYLVEPETELKFSFNNHPYKFIDVETGEELKLNPAQFKEHYQKESKKYLKELRLQCLKHKVDFVELDINKGLDQVLMEYLLKRQKMF